MRCQLNNLDACKQIINGVLNYAQKDFKNQIDFKEGQIIGNAVPLDYTYKQYLTLGLTVGQSLVTAPVLDARLKLGSLYKTFMTKLKFVNHLLNSSSAPLFKEPYKSRLVQEAADLQYDINLLQDPYNGAIGCYLTPDHCVAIANTIQNDLKPIDDAIINQYKLGYFVNVVLGGQTLLYYSIPLGGDQYYSVELPTFNPTSYQLGLSLTDGGNTLVLDEIDVAGNHITGNMRKIAEGVYQGNQIYADHTRFTTFSFIENPL